MSGLENPGVLDAFAYDTGEDKLVLAMYENRPWRGEEKQQLQLEHKLNAYLSFALDGEMTQSFPHLAGKPLEIQLRTVHEPDPATAVLLQRIEEQLSFQEVRFVVYQIDESEIRQGGGGGSCGSGCGCH